MPSIGFIGPFSPPFVGDGIKNDILKEGFLNAGLTKIEFFDSIRRNRSKRQFFSSLFLFLWRHPQLVLSLNKNGRMFVVPLVYFISFFRKKKVVLYVIGGSFDRQIKYRNWIIRKTYVHFLNKLDWIWAESVSLKQGLEEVGLRNVAIVFNPRKDSGARWQLNSANRNKVVFVSRVTKTKGIADLIEAILRLNIEEDANIQLDIYGDVDLEFELLLNNAIAASQGAIAYRGVLNPASVQEVVSGYHLLALPTYHFGEGLPGILVEAGLAGTPILITRFNALGEYFKQNESATFVDVRDVDGICAQLKVMLSDDGLCQALSSGIIKVVEPFKLSSVMDESFRMCRLKYWILE
jgi:glycosyltransferase involved in cell wall biosynthesis